MIRQCYLFALLVLLPIDWFGPTGKLLREFGAKPAVLLLTLGSLVILLTQPVSTIRFPKSTARAGFLLGTILILGLTGFWVNLVFSWSSFDRAKNPVIQFVAQAAIFAAFALAVLAHARLFEDPKARSQLIGALPWAALVHLSVILLEALGLVSNSSGWLSLFRTDQSIYIGRPSGLMSEPSYFGAGAAILGIPLLLIRDWRHRFWARALAIALFVFAIIIRAKTFVPVTLGQFVVYLWMRGRKAVTVRNLVFASSLLLISLFMVVSNAALDLSENLSTVMRVGSTALALNAAAQGYCVPGIGFGQFHFFYSEKFAPAFMAASSEALQEMSWSTDMRASTYNLFVRLLLECGIAGLMLFLFLLFNAMSFARKDTEPATVFAMLLVAGSIAFLCTQDSYFYPPLAVGLAVLLGRRAEVELQQSQS
jgi:hypothetical protein